MITIHCITLLNHSYQEQYFSLFVNVNYHVYHYYMYFNLGNFMLVSVQLVDVVVVFFFCNCRGLRFQQSVHCVSRNDVMNHSAPENCREHNFVAVIILYS